MRYSLRQLRLFVLAVFVVGCLPVCLSIVLGYLPIGDSMEKERQKERTCPVNTAGIATATMEKERGIGYRATSRRMNQQK